MLEWIGAVSSLLFWLWVAWNGLVVVGGYAKMCIYLNPARVHHRHGFKVKIYENFTPVDEHVLVNTHMNDLFDLGDAPLVIDCGMNIGDWPLTLKQQYPAAEVHGFEPFTELAQLAKANMELNNIENVVVNNMGVGEEAGFRRLEATRFLALTASLLGEDDFVNGNSRVLRFFSMAWFISSFLFGDFWYMSASVAGGTAMVLPQLLMMCSLPASGILGSLQPKLSQRVRVIRLGDYMSKQLSGRTVDLLKIDIEGYAYEALLGLDEPAWASIRNVAIELEQRSQTSERQ